MKKLLIATLALITALSISLAACSKDKDTDTDIDDDPDDDLVARPSDDDDDTSTTTGEGDDTTTTANGTWITKNDTIYVLTDCNIRSSATKTSEVKGTATMGTSYQRVETNGMWDKIVVGENQWYILSVLATTSQQRATFVDKTAENKILHVKADTTLNLRCSPLFPDDNPNYDNLVGSINATHTATDSLKLIAVSQDGAWAKVSFTGTTENNKTLDGTEPLYVRTSYLVEFSSNGDSQLPG